MVIFMALIVPLPFTWRRKLFTFISESPIIAKLQYGMKITFIFILILFIDSVNRVYRVQVELAAYANTDNARGGAAVLGGSERMEVQARKFYSQRNMYLCGFTLFLSLILNRTYVMLLDVLRLEEEVKSYKGDTTRKGSSLTDAGAPGEVGKLRKELEAKERDMENLKKQVANMSQEYNRMGDQVSVADTIPKKDR
ncbi:endoplasmic reticulum protein-like protein [Delitschia confertaspora ATCC 74209]|uniref:Endoplasmic reticulum transmembrane protein n=1 Tax=Delitschia confertaspora ATCC 74209 TaxID=1513339 RepID=A0A9P4MQK0_9PLEO|nr:endoplasmic reticulum protein-like protein [Delitschia confertaspora ATCC 74209]